MAADALSALAHPARIRILQHLAGRGEVPCMDIVAAVPLSQPACSRHINDLRKAGLLMRAVEAEAKATPVPRAAHPLAAPSPPALQAWRLWQA